MKPAKVMINPLCNFKQQIKLTAIAMKFQQHLNNLQQKLKPTTAIAMIILQLLNNHKQKLKPTAAISMKFQQHLGNNK